MNYVSVIMANYCNRDYIESAIQSVLSQTYKDIELILSDDASDDGSLEIVRELCARDPRLRLIESPVRTGPAATRNRALMAACGDWIAIVDADDVIHPDRISRLLRAATDLKADAVADDLIYFSENPDATGKTLLHQLALKQPMAVTPSLLVASSLDNGPCGSLGYLKPLLRRAAIGGRRYNETLSIGEDYDLYMRFLTGGASFYLTQESLYLYRRHDSSTSHRLTVEALESMLCADATLLKEFSSDAELSAQIAARVQMLERWLSFLGLIDEVKQWRPRAVVGRLAREPALARELLRSAGERLERRWARRRLESKEPSLVVLVGKGSTVPDEYAAATQIAVPEPGGDTGPEATALWVRLSLEAARQLLHLVVVDNAGLSAAWRVPTATRLTVVIGEESYALPLPPRSEVVHAGSLTWSLAS